MTTRARNGPEPRPPETLPPGRGLDVDNANLGSFVSNGKLLF